MCEKRGYITVEASYICSFAVVLTVYIITICLFCRDSAMVLAIANDAAASEAGRDAHIWAQASHLRDWKRWSGSGDDAGSPEKTAQAKFLFRTADSLNGRALIGCSVRKENGSLCLEYEGIWESPFSKVFCWHSFTISGRASGKTGASSEQVRMIKGLVMGMGGG